MTDLKVFLAENDQPLAIRLQANFVQIFERLETIKPLKAELFSSIIQHKVEGGFGEMRNRSHVLMHFYPYIDTRLFTAKWRFAYASENDQGYFLTFFDRYGRKVYEVSAEQAEQKKALKALALEFEQKDAAEPDCSPEKLKPEFKGDIDELALRKEWRQMTNVHQASKILKQYVNDHRKVFQALGNSFALNISVEQLDSFMTDLSAENIETMGFARSDSAVQCYSGVLPEKEKAEGVWQFNNDEFAMTFDTSQLSEIWLVLKPTNTGWVHSLNCFDKRQQEVLILTDKRPGGESENPAWQALVKNKLHNFELLQEEAVEELKETA